MKRNERKDRVFIQDVSEFDRRSDEKSFGYSRILPVSPLGGALRAEMMKITVRGTISLLFGKFFRLQACHKNHFTEFFEL